MKLRLLTRKLRSLSAFESCRLDERGASLQRTILIVSYVVLAVTAASFIVYNIVSDDTEESNASATQDSELLAPPPTSLPETTQPTTNQPDSQGLPIESTIGKISVGDSHSCVLLEDDRRTPSINEKGRINCWGNNNSGQLGDGTTTSSSIPVRVSGITTAAQVFADYSHTCAVLEDKTIRCWGSNGLGQLGNGGSADSYSSIPVRVSGINTAIQVAPSSLGTCALLEDTTIKCWGYHVQRRMRNFAYGGAVEKIEGITGAVQIASSGENICALLRDETIWCWGNNAYGQLGDGTTVDSSTPVQVSGINTAIQIYTGPGSPCAVLKGGTVKCWGWNGDGILGNLGAAKFSTLPVTVSEISSAVQVSSGSWHTCAVRTDKTVKCLGPGISSPSFEISGAIQVAAGSYHACALLEDNAVKCWGQNDYGQLGDGGTSFSTTPVQAPKINTAIQVAAGYDNTCALLEDKTVHCWGNHFNGLLRNERATDSSMPLPVPGVSSAVQIAIGTGHACAVLEDKTVRCWGNNAYEQLGSSLSFSSEAVQVSGIDTAVQVSAGYLHACALLQDKTVRCWGNNFNSQFGRWQHYRFLYSCSSSRGGRSCTDSYR